MTGEKVKSLKQREAVIMTSYRVGIKTKKGDHNAPQLCKLPGPHGHPDVVIANICLCIAVGFLMFNLHSLGLGSRDRR